jgi:uncharacterized protein
VQTAENVVIGPLIAVLSFVCSVGNIPLAAVLWAGGTSFAGVIAFIYADLITLPILLIYRKYYGTRFALKLAGLMFGCFIVAALAVDGLFSALGVSRRRARRSSRSPTAGLASTTRPGAPSGGARTTPPAACA